MRLVLLALALLGTVAAQERPLPDFQTFAAQVKKRLATDEARQSGYTFLERRIEQKLDASGRRQPCRTVAGGRRTADHQWWPCPRSG